MRHNARMMGGAFGPPANGLIDRIEAEAKAAELREEQPGRSRKGNAPKYNKTKARAKAKAQRKARKASK